MDTIRNIGDESGQSTRRRARRVAAGAVVALVAGMAVAACGNASSAPGAGHPSTAVGAAAGGGGTSPAAGGSTTSGGAGSSAAGGTTTTSTSTTTTTTTAPPAPPLGLGVQGTLAQVPWSEVGAAWTLAVVHPEDVTSSRVAGPRSLYLVDPLGGRYLVSNSLAQGWSIADWSGDGQDALLTHDVLTPDYTVASTSVMVLDLRTGVPVDQFSLAGMQTMSFSRPDGLALIAAGGGTVARYSLAGSLEASFPTSFSQVGSYDGSAIETPDGALVVVGASGGIALVWNSGSVFRQIPVAAGPGCSPVKWWSPNVLLAACGGTTIEGYRYLGSLWTVPIDGGPATPLVPFNVQSGTNGTISLAEDDAWSAGGSTYGIFAIACGATGVARVSSPSGPATVLSVPGVIANPQIVGGYGDELEVQAVESCDTPTSPGFSLIWWNPATDAATVVLGAPLSGGSVESALLDPVDGNYP